jgi:hypothetical protein
VAVTQAQLVEALTASKGIFSLAGQSLGITGQAVGQRVAKSEKLQELVKAQITEINDLAVGHTVKAIQGGDLKTVRWWLEHRHPDFIPKREVTGKDGAPLIDPEAVLLSLTHEELAAIRNIRARAREGQDPGS